MLKINKWRELLIPDFSNELKALLLMRFAFKEETFKPKTDQSEMVRVEYKVPCQHAVRSEGE